MKNLTRVLALVLTFAMMISTVAMAATFTDIEEGSTYAEATAVLADLGILKGYEDGTFGADKVITRAEVVAVVNRLQGLSDAAKAAGGATQYTDVPSTEWYAGDVNLATQMGIVSGDGNGLFRPNDQVKYEEAVKMVVAALGYNQEYALKRGGWPTGYLVIATEAEISKGLSAAAGDPAYRGIVAKLAYNALTAPTFAFKEYSTDGKAVYEVNKAKITLEEKLQTYKLTGYVRANSTTAIGTQTTDNDKINFLINENKVGKIVTDWSLTTSTQNQYGVEQSTTVATKSATFLVGATDVASTLGYTTDIYVKENAEGDFEVISYVLNETKNDLVVIEDPTTISTVYKTNLTPNTVFPSKFEGTTTDVISVYDEDVDTTNTEYFVDKEAKLIVNGQYMGLLKDNTQTWMHNLNTAPNAAAAQSDLGFIYAPKYGTVTLLDNGNDGVYDVAFVDSYEVAVVLDVIDTTTTKQIATTGNSVIDLKDHIEGKQGYTYSLTLDGEEATLADLQENDVIAVAMTKNGKYYDIMATRNVVSGLVSEADKSAADIADFEYIIDGVSYKAANLAEQDDTEIDDISVGDEATFYLDAFGNVALAEKTSSASKNYGFIVSAGADSSVGDTTYQVRLLDKEGNIQTYALAEKVRYATPAQKGTPTSGIADATVYAAINALAPVPATSTTAADWTLYNINTDANIDAYAKRIITYKTNSNGEINELVFAAQEAKANITGKETYLTYATGMDDIMTAADNDQVQFDAKTSTFLGGYSVNENTVVFNLSLPNAPGTPANKLIKVAKEDLKIETIASLSHTDKYDVAFMGVDKDGIASVVIVVNNAASVTKGSNLAVVKKVMSAQNAEFDNIYNITFVQGGEEKTLATTREVADIGMPAVGSVFEYATNEEGEIKAIGFGGNYLKVADLTTYNSNFVIEGAKEQFVYGSVYGKSNSRIIKIGAAYAPHAIPETANFILVDLSKANGKVVVSVASYAEFREIRHKTANDPTTPILEDYDYTVFMKYYNDEITDVVIYKGANAAGFGSGLGV